MPPRKTRKKVPRRIDVKNAAERLRKTLAKQTKPILLDLIVDFASEDRTIMRKLEERFDIEQPVADLVAATRQAIADATDFDDREINYNFDYDYDAYKTVKRNLKQLVKLGNYHETMELSIDLMDQGSHQVESSDEGLMTEDIDDCLRVVVKALEKSELPAEEVLEWQAAMVASDRVGFICEDELNTLRTRFTP